MRISQWRSAAGARLYGVAFHVGSYKDARVETLRVRIPSEYGSFMIIHYAEAEGCNTATDSVGQWHIWYEEVNSHPGSKGYGAIGQRSRCPHRFCCVNALDWDMGPFVFTTHRLQGPLMGLSCISQIRGRFEQFKPDLQAMKRRFRATEYAAVQLSIVSQYLLEACACLQ